MPGTATVFCMLILALITLCSAAAASVLALPSGLAGIEDETFLNNQKIDEVQLRGRPQYIGHRAFANSSVRYLYLPSSITRIEDDAFDQCPNLICLVPENSYAQEWCSEHNVTWHHTDYVASLTLSEKSLTLGNGEKKTITATVEPAGAAKRLIWASGDETIFSVNKNGEVAGLYPGKARLVVSSKDGTVKKGITVTVKANYRALLFSESTFSGGVIKRNRGDVRLMESMLEAVTGPDGGMYRKYSYDDLVAKDVYQQITDKLITPSRDGDVSIFFFASHGDFRSTTEQYAGRLWCRNKKTWLELPTLAKELSKIKGKVIVLLESCGPGAAVHVFNGSGDGAWTDYEDDPATGEGIVTAFSSADPGLAVYQPKEIAEDEAGDSEIIRQYLEGQVQSNGSGSGSSGNLFLTEKFVVMTASAYLQKSYSIGTDTYNLFPTWLVNGVGTAGTMPADKECGNNDGKLTVKELFQYVYNHTRYKQTPQVYPQNSSYVLFLRKQ